MKKLTATLTIALLCLSSQSTALLAAENMKEQSDIPKICLNGSYIAYTEPSIYWADINGDNEDEIIIVLTDGVNRGTGVLLQSIHVLDKSGAEIIVDDAEKHAANLLSKTNSADTFVQNWTHYTVNDGKLLAEIAVVEQGESKNLQLTYQYKAGKMQITDWDYQAEE